MENTTNVTSETSYEKRLEEYKLAHLTSEVNQVEINYLKAKLEVVDKHSNDLNQSIKNYENEYEQFYIKLMEITRKQGKANIILKSLKQYEAELQNTIFKEELVETNVNIEDNKLENLKLEVDTLRSSCSENNEILKKLFEEFREIMNNCN